MANKPIDDVLETLSQMPKLHRGLQRNIFKKVLESLKEGISRHHLEILKLLYEEGTLHVAEIADLLLISKSQMTRLIDELIRLGMVERQPDTQDRRKSNILLTHKGTAIVKEVRVNIQANIKTWLSSLTDEELRELSTSFKKIQNIIMKLK
jgi:DNA-binding MarR family transcriptional regulator